MPKPELPGCYLDRIGDETYSTVLVGNGYVPTAALIQGVPLECRIAGEEYDPDQVVQITRDTAPCLIADLQRWLAQQEAVCGQAKMYLTVDVK